MPSKKKQQNDLILGLAFIGTAAVAVFSTTYMVCDILDKRLQRKPSKTKGGRPIVTRKIYGDESMEKRAFEHAANMVMMYQKHGLYEDINRWKWDADKGVPNKDVDLEFWQIASLARRDGM